MQYTDARLDEIIGRDVYDMNGTKVGPVEQVYADDQTGQPSWLAVSTGFFSNKAGFIPLERSWYDEKGNLSVPYTKDQIKDAPHIDQTTHMTEAEQDQLYRHYGGQGKARRDDDTITSSGRVERERQGEVVQEVDLTNEEVDTEHATRQVTSKARLRKYTETEYETVRIPIQKERVVLEQEGVTDTRTTPKRSGQ